MLPAVPLSPETRSRRYESLGAWRGVAALSVLLFHSFGRFEQESIWGPLEPVRHAAGFGWLGVHLFFVISGYCIAEKITALSRRQAGPTAFWKNRLGRILPPYWAALLFALALNLAAVPFNHVPWRAQLPASPSDALEHLLLIEPYFGRPASLLVAWTLTCEIGFYAIAGCALALPAGPRSLALAWTAGALLCLAPLVSPVLATHPIIGSWPDFFAGVAAFQAVGGDADGRFVRRGWLGLGALVGIGAMRTLTVAHSEGGWYRLDAPVFAGILIGLHPWDQRVMSFASVRLLAAAGMISFSLYLVHVPVVSPMINLGMRWIPATSAGFLPLWLASVVAALGAAVLFHRWVEHPVELWRKRHAP